MTKPEPIAGAAYVSITDNVAWTDTEIYTFEPEEWPEDFVLIWAPGDAIPVRETTARSVVSG